MLRTVYMYHGSGE